jgi:hypothetical protein
VTPEQVFEATQRANDVHRFPRLCEITTLEDRVVKIDPTPTQRIIMGLLDAHPNTFALDTSACWC